MSRPFLCISKTRQGLNVACVALVFSLLEYNFRQLVLDCWNAGDWGGIAGYPVKFAIGFVSVFFDLIFLLQVCVAGILFSVVFICSCCVASVVFSLGRYSSFRCCLENNINCQMRAVALSPLLLFRFLKKGVRVDYPCMLAPPICLVLRPIATPTLLDIPNAPRIACCRMCTSTKTNGWGTRIYKLFYSRIRPRPHTFWVSCCFA